MSALIIASMHRSGSSLTAALLQRSGLNIGQRLMNSSSSNLKGHFENLDFYEFHQKLLKSQEFHEDGWITQPLGAFDESFTSDAKQIIERNRKAKLWGWKEPRTTLFLDFWYKLLPDAKFLFVYRSPWDVIDSLYRRGDPFFLRQPELAPQIWLHYNQEIIKFYKQNPGACFLVNIQTIIEFEKLFIAAINEKLSIDLNSPESTCYEPNLFKSDLNKAYLFEYYFPDAFQIFHHLENLSWKPDTTSTVFSKLNQVSSNRLLTHNSREAVINGLHTASKEKLISQYWLKYCSIAKRDESNKAQILNLQEELDQSRALIQKFEDQLRQYNDQLQQKEVLLLQSRSNQRYSNYQLLVFKACVEYQNGCLNTMAQYFEQAISCTPFSAADTIVDWLKSLSQFCFYHGRSLDIPSFSKNLEWQQVMKKLINIEEKRTDSRY